MSYGCLSVCWLTAGLASPVRPRDICALGHITCPDRNIPGQTVCINPFTDNNYCGRASECKQCASGTNCIGGACGTCPAGQSLCYDYISSYCADLNTSVRDCGACGVPVSPQ